MHLSLFSRPEQRDGAAQSRDHVGDYGSTPVPHAFVDKDFWVYIMASGPRGVLYVGTTSDLVGRVEEHVRG